MIVNLGRCLVILFRIDLIMYYLAVLTDLFHAIVMLAWVLGLPLLFWYRYPKLSSNYAIYSIFFIIVNLSSQYFLGRCILTEISDYFWKHSSAHVDTSEWFTVKFSKLIFGLTPSHFLIKRITEFLILISSIGGLFLRHKKNKMTLARI
jgi:hypothetical protein